MIEATEMKYILRFFRFLVKNYGFPKEEEHPRYEDFNGLHVNDSVDVNGMNHSDKDGKFTEKNGGTSGEVEKNKSQNVAKFNKNPENAILLPDGTKVGLTKGTKITNIFNFAGKGSKTGKAVKLAKELSKRYNVPENSWSKKQGNGFVDYKGKSRKSEIHWFESEGNGKTQMKVTRFLDES